jgi:hypothetical protein
VLLPEPLRAMPRAAAAQLKEALCFVSPHYLTDRVQAARDPQAFAAEWTAPDGSTVRLHDERFRCAEARRARSFFSSLLCMSWLWLNFSFAD